MDGVWNAVYVVVEQLEGGERDGSTEAESEEQRFVLFESERGCEGGKEREEEGQTEDYNTLTVM